LKKGGLKIKDKKSKCVEKNLPPLLRQVRMKSKYLVIQTILALDGSAGDEKKGILPKFMRVKLEGQLE
jgi:hypothetical protein